MGWVLFPRKIRRLVILPLIAFLMGLLFITLQPMALDLLRDSSWQQNAGQSNYNKMATGESLTMNDSWKTAFSILDVRNRTDLGKEEPEVEGKDIGLKGPPAGESGMDKVRNEEIIADPVFDPREPKLVLALGYQRVGSSFIGYTLFNLNPGVFYVYEPLDMIYTTMYGIQEGYAVPQNIGTFKDGSPRPLPKHEQEAVQWLLTTLYECDMMSLPPEVLSHRFWKNFAQYMNVVKPYSACLKRKKKKVPTATLR